MKSIVVFILLVVTVNSYAQKFQFGLKAGANISNFTGGNFEDVKKKSIVGFHGGLYTQFRFLKFGIQPEAFISTQGARIDSVSGSYDWKLTYVNVPVMLQYFTGLGLYLEAGPQVGFKITENLGDQTVNDFAKNLDLSIAAGLGFRGKKGLGIGIRYTTGISKVGDYQPANGIDPDFKNAVIQGSVYIPLAN